VDLTLRRGLEPDDEEDLLLLLAEQIRLLALVLGTLDVSKESGESLLALRLADGEFLDGRERGEVARSDRGGLPERRRSFGGAARGGGDGDGRHVNWSVDRVRATERRAEGATRISLPLSLLKLNSLFLRLISIFFSSLLRAEERVRTFKRYNGQWVAIQTRRKRCCVQIRGEEREEKRAKDDEGVRG
jgi:hypothetical protein